MLGGVAVILLVAGSDLEAICAAGLRADYLLPVAPWHGVQRHGRAEVLGRGGDTVVRCPGFAVVSTRASVEVVVEMLSEVPDPVVVLVAPSRVLANPAAMESIRRDRCLVALPRRKRTAWRIEIEPAGPAVEVVDLVGRRP